MTATVTTPERVLVGVRGEDESSMDLDRHLAAHGPLVAPDGDARWGAWVHRAVAESGLLGRGGAGFPSAGKWEAGRMASRRPVLVVNALEGEPASAKDRVLLLRCPHLVLDGAEAVAAAVRASEILLCVPDHSWAVAASLEAALTERRRAGLSGRRVAVRRPPGRYVTGEESALTDWLGGGPGRPMMRMDKSVPLRMARRAALVHNVETLAHVALIARRGPEWFRQLGTPDAPGSTLVTVTGAGSGPVVLEVELGTPVSQILRWGRFEDPPSAVLLGGYGGTWLEGSRLDTPYAPAPLASVGATMGVGVVVGLPATSCGIAETARIARYLAGESAGQCGPCVFGLPAIAGDLELLSSGRPDPSALERVAGRTSAVDGRGACRHPDGLTRLVRSALRVFAADASSHALGRPCSGHISPTVLPLPPGSDPRGDAS
ncbi:MAG TPA: NADH-ubiquinone oxidoreductase-F iron-sulfur binding region domain-containing protein [Acidimicrobiales bacterium]|nr:NADH-ubiquinone oxidoreductase-F iron-sulfur binding region domain-containing protein [Acidimicrobiales bacterium]